MKSKTEITIFTSDIFGEIRTCQVNNQIMFVGKDVATALGYRNPSNALQVHVDPEDKTTYPIQVSGSNYKTNALFVNKVPLYRHQSIPLSLMKCRLAGLEDSP